MKNNVSMNARTLIMCYKDVIASLGAGVDSESDDDKIQQVTNAEV